MFTVDRIERQLNRLRGIARRMIRERITSLNGALNCSVKCG